MSVVECSELRCLFQAWSLPRVHLINDCTPNARTRLKREVLARERERERERPVCVRVTTNVPSTHKYDATNVNDVNIHSNHI